MCSPHLNGVLARWDNVLVGMYRSREDNQFLAIGRSHSGVVFTAVSWTVALARSVTFVGIESALRVWSGLQDFCL